MGLVTCPDCQREISDQSVTCIGCGRPMGAREQTVRIDINRRCRHTGVWPGIGPAVSDADESAIAQIIDAGLAPFRADGWRPAHDTTYRRLLEAGRLHHKVKIASLGFGYRVDVSDAEIRLVR